jgi:amino acid transporter
MNNTANESLVNTEEQIQADFNGPYSARVHLIGRSTMLIALVLSFMPIAYLYFVKGYQAPVHIYVTVTATLFALCIGMWITEPLIYYPMLGAAATYMSYLAGNCKNVRLPVQKSVLKRFGEKPSTPRGQILSAYCVGFSVFVNLAVLTVVVLTGSYFVPLLPKIVLVGLDHVIPALIGTLLWFRIEESGWKKTLTWAVPAVIIWITIRKLDIEWLSDIGEAISIGATILLGYLYFKSDRAKKADEDAEKN